MSYAWHPSGQYTLVCSAKIGLHEKTTFVCICNMLEWRVIKSRLDHLKIHISALACRRCTENDPLQRAQCPIPWRAAHLHDGVFQPICLPLLMIMSSLNNGATTLGRRHLRVYVCLWFVIVVEGCQGHVGIWIFGVSRPLRVCHVGRLREHHVKSKRLRENFVVAGTFQPALGWTSCSCTDAESP